MRGKTEEQEQGIVVVQSENPIAEIKSKIKQVEVRYKSWLSKQSVAVEAAVVRLVTISNAAQGVVIGSLMGVLIQNIPLPPLPPQNSLHQPQALAVPPLIQGRNLAVMFSVDSGISTVLRRLKGKEDVQSNMIAAFGSGAMYSLVSGAGGPNQIPNMVSTGLFFALARGAMDKLGEKFRKPPAEGTTYLKIKNMLSNLGLQNYEKNFKKGRLNDLTLPLLTDSALRDANIPPGPRLLILDHVKRDPELSKKQSK